jgi:hypothetical protein
MQYTLGIIMQRLVVIGDPKDKQASKWHTMALSLGADSIFLSAAQINRQWRLDLGEERMPAIICSSGERLEIIPNSSRWYLRGPSSGNLRIREQLQLLHQYASRVYENGDYFLSADSEVHTESKPLQAVLAPCRVPVTRVRRPVRLMSANWVTKSLSHVRSKVVDSSHPGLLLSNDGNMAAPSMFQHLVHGLHVKVHCYYSRCQTWKLFAVSAKASCIDYRYSSDVEYAVEQVRCRWYHYAQRLYEYLRIRFFDFDLVVSGSFDTFLEVNSSPAPVYFENILEDYRYSAHVLLDWLHDAS